MVLIANRGEAGVRVARAAATLGLPSVAVHAADDAGSLHVRAADAAVALPGRGPEAYLDAAALVAVARTASCTVVHPGWGFLSESAAFAAACAEAGLAFAGPRPGVLEALGDKVAARALAERLGVPVPRSTGTATTLDEARRFAGEVGPVMVKAVSGGGGRGMRAVRDVAALDDAWRRCAAEARLATGSEALYVEELVTPARHIEVQVAGDGSGAVVALGDRDCSVQRRHQKVVEVAPAPGLTDARRAALADAALRMAAELRLGGLATFEFLVSAEDGGRFAFIEANPRLQVEHTVTEAVLGIDLVAAQLRLALGARLGDLGLPAPPVPRGSAVQARVVARGAGRLERFAAPAGDGVRVDAGVAEGDAVTGAFDPLLAKVVAHDERGLAAAVDRAREAIGSFAVAGVATNLGELREILGAAAVREGRATTTWLDARAAGAGADEPGGDGAAVEKGDDGAAVEVRSPLTGVVVEVVVPAGEPVAARAPVLVVEAMKMHHEITAPAAGVVRHLAAAVGEHVREGEPVIVLEPTAGGDGAAPAAAGPADIDLDAIRDDLAAVLERRRRTLDEGRPAAVERRRRIGRRTARENVGDLCDPGTFVEYGAFALAAQRARRSEDELLEQTPADGMVCGIGGVNGAAFGEEASRCVVLAYDYTVLAGTQGVRNHRKTDRMLEVAERLRLPVVLFAEGGGGRPGDTDQSELFHLVVPTFGSFARLSGLVPRVGVVSGRCFAGNAALLGCCDVIIATPDASIGMGGPAMIEGGGLGRFAPEEVGPVDVQRHNGVIDVVAEDEAAAVAIARRFLSYFQGPVADWSCADQRQLRALVPEDPKRIHDVRRVLAVLADTGSVLELRRDFGRGMLTALVRIEGRPVGVLANDPAHLSGAVDAEGSDKAARFLQLCDAFGLPVVSLVDTPGFMVGPDCEATAMVRRCSRMFVTAATLSVPWISVVVRRAFGLGAQAMTGGSFHAPVRNVAWPTGEFGAMGVEGAVRLALRRELEAIEDAASRERRVQELVAQVRAQSGALTMAAHFEIDDVIDPADTRGHVLEALRAAGAPVTDGRRRTMVDTW